MKRPRWLAAAAIRAMQAELIAEHGGLAGKRDENAMESTLARPKHLWTYSHPTLSRLTAAYAFGFARNHVFSDGNKRIALVAAAVFLELNGLELVAPEAEAVVMMRELAAGKIDEEELARWIEANSKRCKSY